MECLENLIGLTGGCAAIAGESDLTINGKITYNELTQFVDQNDFASVDDMFSSIRVEAVREVLDEIQAHMQGKYISRTVVGQHILGNYGNGLTESAASANYKGLILDRCTTQPYLQYRVTQIGLILDHAGSVTVRYFDGLTGKQLATDSVTAIAGELVTLNVNRVFRVQKLLVVYDATSIDGYVTRISYTNSCMTCPNRWNVSKHTTARGVNANLSNVNTRSYSSDLGGLQVSVAMECDHQTWLCGIREHLSMPIMFKICELIMEYAVNNSGRSGTKMTRDSEKLKDRQMMYHSKYGTSMKSALNRLTIPNEPICFDCRKRAGIYQSIP